ncbi:hypothetical protein [Bartonella machadoae]|uniref:hypothetical protein n=1 Tax=Bartonella machadoae TaxID=2893471 RepID=UPI001F4C8247|nr:hypothetical protein [Bartonella machadoae]UNE53828.1 hypothetical protein LNM86_09490 [Bartonella machadoae]
MMTKIRSAPQSMLLLAKNACVYGKTRLYILIANEPYSLDRIVCKFISFLQERALWQDRCVLLLQCGDKFSTEILNNEENKISTA